MPICENIYGMSPTIKMYTIDLQQFTVQLSPLECLKFIFSLMTISRLRSVTQLLGIIICIGTLDSVV